MTPCDMSAAMVERFASIGVKYILCRSIGYDHVDLAKARECGMRVSNVSYPPSGVANYAIMLAMMLQRRIVSILKRAELQDYSLKEKIGEGLQRCRFGIVVLSPEFIGREWTEKELAELLGRQNASHQKVVLPLLYNLTVDEMRARYPALGDLKARQIATREDAKDVVIDFARVLIKSLRRLK